MHQIKKNSFLIIILSIFIVVAGYMFFKIYSFSSTETIVQYETSGQKIADNYFDYSLENLAKADEDGEAVLFFSTNWCSTCTELDKELINESEKLKDGITILRIDYDKADDMKKKYRVAVQHTLIHVNGDGEEINKWVGGDIEEINKNIR